MDHNEPSTPDPPNTGQLIDSNYEMETTEKFMEDYYGANIDHNNPNFHMIQKTVEEERRTLRASIDLFKNSKLPYSSTNYLLIKKTAGSETRQRNDRYTAEKSTPQVNNAKSTKTN